MGMASANDCIIDHCSISWTLDESFSSRGGKNITLQRTLISEALNAAGHKKYPPGTQHGYAASIGSFHHNLLANNEGRNWSLAGGLEKKTSTYAGRMDLRNNVVFNWNHRATDGGAHEVNFVNNYYQPGPAPPQSDVAYRLLKPESERSKTVKDHFGQAYVSGNIVEGYDRVT